MPDVERSQSRGREPFHSTGRGGIGNIRLSSASRDTRPSTGPDDFSITRGREPIPHQHQQLNQAFSTGRGGAGNLRSPSRDPHAPTTTAIAEADAAEQEVIREYVAAHEGTVHSSGRGGLGNITRSRSRDPAASPGRNNPKHATDHIYSTGRGGAGNVRHSEASENFAEELDEEERRKVGHPLSAVHSTGRGGSANLTTTHEPPIEHHPHPHPPQHTAEQPEFESTGRGGLGNIVHERSLSRTRS
ncbi:hypothetical protein CPB84DRAFT_1687917 [Gymnopilus junonius]|uniref:Uncharacterized protein n=1 Tax=Gymnopilus junonius TaxID=109634 RepID=A0A9P5TGV9_GYMJU|nr:hypothetical protein CPB84DRAFT_1687917 [Gymnopilus junonius]